MATRATMLRMVPPTACQKIEPRSSSRGAVAASVAAACRSVSVARIGAVAFWGLDRCSFRLSFTRSPPLREHLQDEPAPAMHGLGGGRIAGKPDSGQSQPPGDNAEGAFLPLVRGGKSL